MIFYSMLFIMHLDLLRQAKYKYANIQICKEPKLPFSPDIQTSSKHSLQANLSTSRGWDFLRGWMSVRVRGKRSSKGVDEDEEDEEEEEVEEEGDRVEIGRVGREEEKCSF